MKNVDGCLRAVDLGAGTGISTQYLCKYFKEVFAVEPDSRMLNKSNVPNNCKVYNCTSEQFEVEPDSVDVITAGNSFYWMNGEDVIKKIYRWLKGKGIFAAYRYDFPQIESQVQSIIQEELVQRWNLYRSDRLINTDYTINAIRNSQLFSEVTIITIPNVVKLSAEEVVGFFRSTSYGSAYIRTLENKETYISRLTDDIKKVSNNTKIPMDFSIELIIAIK